jgi:hypothetical protein
MEELKIFDVFTEEDIKFNRKMVDEGLKSKKTKPSIFKNRNCDYTSEIINEFRRKWGICE